MQKTIHGIDILATAPDARLYSIIVYSEASSPRETIPMGNWGVTIDGKILTGNVHWEKSRDEYRLKKIVQPLHEIDKKYFLSKSVRLQLIGVDWLKRNRSKFDENSFKDALKLMSRKTLQSQRDLEAAMSKLRKKYDLLEPPFNCTNCKGHVHALYLGNMGIFSSRHILDANEPVPTLTTGNGIGFIQGGKWRYATELERERLMGMPDHWTAYESNSSSQRIKQTGNAVVIHLMSLIWTGIMWNLRVHKVTYVGASEIDAHARKVYMKNFKAELSHSDIRTVNADPQPWFDDALEEFKKEGLMETFRKIDYTNNVFDSFSGVGGFRLSLDWVIQAINNRMKDNPNYREVFNRDIRAVAPGVYWEISKSPDRKSAFGVFCGGFPCTTFSTAGKRLGFADQTKGTLFFEIVRIAKEFRPKIFFLENVKGLLTHDSGKTFRTIICAFAEMGYNIEWQLISSRYLVPQDRERVYIVAHRSDLHWTPIFPLDQGKVKELRNAFDYWESHKG